MKIEVSFSDQNKIVNKRLTQYYMQVLNNGGDSTDWHILSSIQDVLSHFMTDHEYEDFNNGLRQNTLTL
jgi:hypothetical protein|tara:strand:+ start:92 stop:298 length:207 start_codon:yes stop_codon:yes gene_type:complete